MLIPKFSREPPLKPGDTVVRMADQHSYKVKSCQESKCEACGGTGLDWTVVLQGEYQRFNTTLKNLGAKKNYELLRPLRRTRKREPRVDGQGPSKKTLDTGLRDVVKSEATLGGGECRDRKPRRATGVESGSRPARPKHYRRPSGD